MEDIVDRETGQVMSQDDVEFAYTRQGRHEIGREFPNPMPLAPPIGFVPQPPIWEQIRAMVQRELSATAGANDAETFEEADDFDVGDDFDPTTPYEEVFEPEHPWPPSKAAAAAEDEAVAARARVDRLRAELAEAEKDLPPADPPSKVAPPQGAGPEDAKPGA